MGRLNQTLLDRVEQFSHRVVDVVEVLESQGRARRVVDQVIGSGTSVAANVWEASEALSAADLCKTLGTALKELSETRYWLRFVWKRGWVDQSRLKPLEQEADELTRVLGSIVARTKRRTATRKP